MMNTVYLESNDLEKNLLNLEENQINNVIFFLKLIYNFFFYLGTSLLIFIDIYIFLYFIEKDNEIKAYYDDQIKFLVILVILLYTLSCLSYGLNLKIKN